MSLTFDKARDTKKSRADFAYSRKVENRYARLLRQVARHVGEIVDGFDTEDPAFVSKVNTALGAYAELIKPWASATAYRIIQEIARRDERVWAQVAEEFGKALRREIRTAPTGQLFRQLMAEQVDLITSIPIKAARRVHRLTIEAAADSTRAKEIAQEIKATSHVTASRATLIARTETARTASALTMARAMHVGSTGYVWRTSRDADVRRSHREMEGQFVKWDEPPKLSDGTVTHAGMIYNCRCYPEPVLPDSFD